MCYIILTCHRHVFALATTLSIGEAVVYDDGVAVVSGFTSVVNLGKDCTRCIACLYNC